MKHLFKVSLVFLFTALFSACEEKDPPLPDNLLQFESAEQGLESSQKELTVKLKLSRAVDVATKVVIKPTFDGVTYGTEVTTTPEVASDLITLTIPAASAEGSFKLTRKDGVFLKGTESVTFAVQSVDSPVLVGTVPSLKVKFSTIVSEGTTIQLNGGTGGANALNAVYVDLSNNAQTAAVRGSWDFGFSTGSDFNVILNNFIATTAIATTKSDINTVTAADTVGKGLVLNFGAGQLALVDDIDGDLTKTVIKPVSATDADNKVYIVRRGTGGGLAAKDLVKVRVLRNGSNYSLQYAKLSETTFKTATITKVPANNFTFFSVETEKTVDVEPAKASWDFVWGGSINKTSNGTELIPYYFSDLVFTNIYGGTQVAEVLTSAVTYDNYAESNIATTVFAGGVAGKFVIGSNWRITSGTPIGVKTDRFYVIKDSAGNIYKVKFVNFHSSDGGERGKPTITYKLVKKG